MTLTGTATTGGVVGIGSPHCSFLCYLFSVRYTVWRCLCQMEQERELALPSEVLLNDLQHQLQKLPEGLRSKFVLVLAVSERARQLVEQAERERSDENPVLRALQEFSERRFEVRISDERFLRALQGKPEDTDIFPYRP